jgi:restriction system protein
MPIPDFQSLMLPIMTVAADGVDHTASDLRDRIAESLGLTDAERKEPLPSGQQPIFANRVAWGRTHLQMAGLLEKISRGTFRITTRGQATLATKPPTINLRFLRQFPEYAARRNKPPTVESNGATDSAAATAEEMLPTPRETPAERIESAFSELSDSLRSELLGRLSSVDPFRFEQVVLDLLVAMGYGGSRKEAAEVTQRTGDGGIDGLINEDRLGLDVIYVQAKRWKTNVGRPEIQGFVGALAGRKATKGIFITTSGFVANAHEYAAGLHQKVILMDGRRLAELMIEHGIGVASEQIYHVKKIDSDYFGEV